MGSINAAGYDWNEPIAPDPDHVDCLTCGIGYWLYDTEVA